MSPTDPPTREALMAALETVRDPASGRGLASAGLVQGLSLRDGRASFVLEVAAADAPRYAEVPAAAERALLALPGVARANVVLTAHAAAAPAAPARRAQVAADPRADVSNLPPPQRLAGVRRVIAVASGKGGVGKSTVAVNLACAFARLGLKTGLLDADIYGPSAPRMSGIDGRPVYAEGKLEPLFAWGVAWMSIGFIAGEGQAMPWRGPMVSSALRQMIEDVRWDVRGTLDVLVVDLPPGTGDIHLTLVQRLAVDGVVVVSTPSEVALADARRAVTMFGKVRPPVAILGLIENMAFFPDPATGAPLAIFGHGEAQAEARRLDVPFLGEIPIDIALRQGGDRGRPLVADAPDSPVARAFLDLAEGLADLRS